MKLYATVQSERASKGQGGNNQIVIDLIIDDKLQKEIGRVVMKYENETYTVYYYPINENCTKQEINSGRVLLYQETITKEKAYTCYEEHTSGAYAGCSIPHVHEAEAKGKKQQTAKCCEYSGEELPCNICPKDGYGNCTAI